MPRDGLHDRGHRATQPLVGEHDREHHAHGEPVAHRGQGADPREALGEGPDGVEHAEPPGRHGERDEGEQVRDRSAPGGEPRDQQGDHGERDVEHHLGRQAPQLGQPGEVPLQSHALQLQQVRGPDRPGGRAGLGDEEEGSHEDGQPGRDQPGRAAQRIGPGVGRRPAGDHVSCVRAVEEEAAEDEEDRHADVHAGQEPGQRLAPGGPGEEPGVGEEHRDGRECPQAFELEEVVRPPRRDGGRGRGRRAHEPAPTVTTRAEVTHTPAVLGVSTVRVIDSTATP